MLLLKRQWVIRVIRNHLLRSINKELYLQPTDHTHFRVLILVFFYDVSLFLSFSLCASPQPLWLQRQAPTSLWLTWTALAITTSTRWPWDGARSPPPPPPGTHKALETLLLNLILLLAILHSPTSLLYFLMLSLLCFLIVIFLSPSSSLTFLVPTHISHRSVCHPFSVCVFCVCFPLLCRPLPLILRCRTEMELYASLPRR